MIVTYLRLDLFNLSKKKSKSDSQLVDQISLEINEDIDDFLSASDDADYAELVLITQVHDNMLESPFCRLCKQKIKGKKSYEWKVCSKKDIYSRLSLKKMS